MLKAYRYFDGDIVRCFPMSLAQIERARVKLPPTFDDVLNPEIADIFWIPIDLGHVEAYHGGVSAIRECLPRLPFWKGNERRHVAYFCSDGAEPVNAPLIMFRQSFYKDRRDENAIAWPYAVEDFGDLVTGDFDAMPYDVSFVGSKVSSKSRIESFESVQRSIKLKHFLDDSKLHWGSIEYSEIGKQRKALFRQSLRDSRMVLAARGGGMSCYRFFEAMSAGRVPVLFADDWELPHQDIIDWDRCIIQIAERDATRTADILEEHVKTANLNMMGQEARYVWKSFLAPEVWPQMMELCARKKLA
jgi:hypothetical protein